MTRNFKYCIVRECKSSTITTPNKIFFSVPKGKTVREKWWAAIKRDEKRKKLSFNSCLHCCEDHFSLKEDMKNYLELHLTGGVKQYRLKDGVLPHVFDCQATDGRSQLESKAEAVSEEENAPYPVGGIYSASEVTATSMSTEECVMNNAVKSEPDPLEAMSPDVCCVRGCKFSLPSVEKFSLFPLPEDEGLREKWLQSIPHDLSSLQSPRICEEHFLLEDVIRTPKEECEVEIKRSSAGSVLREHAVPTVFSMVPSGIDLKESDEGLHASCKHGETPVTLTGEKTFVCNICNKAFRYKSRLEAHLFIHTIKKPYQCERCKQTFKRKRNLIRHLKIHIVEKHFLCDYCNKAFTAWISLKKHLLIHSDERPYQCEHCNKAFKQKTNLRIHLKTHTGEKPFLCDFCNKAFRARETLEKHLLIHTGEKPFLCDFCNKAFRARKSLKVHLRIHTGEKPYQCENCNKAFSWKSALVVHIRTHTGEKPYQCEICNKTFRQKSGFNNHLRTHSGDNEQIFY